MKISHQTPRKHGVDDQIFSAVSSPQFVLGWVLDVVFSPIFQVMNCFLESICGTGSLQVETSIHAWFNFDKNAGPRVKPRFRSKKIMSHLIFTIPDLSRHLYVNDRYSSENLVVLFRSPGRNALKPTKQSWGLKHFFFTRAWLLLQWAIEVESAGQTSRRFQKAIKKQRSCEGASFFK